MRQRLCTCRQSALAVMAATLVVSSCADNANGTSEPGIGVLLVTTTTIAPIQFMPYGNYGLRIDDASPAQIGINARWVGVGVAAGMHRVGLDLGTSGSMNNCAIAPANQVSVSVPASDTGRVAFTVTCRSPYPILRVVTTTTGADAPATYRVAADSNPVTNFTVRATGDTTAMLYNSTPNAPARTISLRLEQIPGNCAVNGSAARSVVVSSGDTTRVAFDVACTALPVDSGFPFTDPVGDTLSVFPISTGAAVDLRRVDGRFSGDTIIAVFRFTGLVNPPAPSGQMTIGFLDIDLDENAATGVPGTASYYGATGAQGAEATLSLNSDTTAMLQVYLGSSQTLRLVRDADSLLVRIPLAVLGGTGTFRWSMVFGNTIRPTDIAPVNRVWRVVRPTSVP